MASELWDVYDSQGNITGRTKTSDDIFCDGEYHLIASLWIINTKGEALIQKRAQTKRINPGMWNITGGSVNAGESSVNACVREVAEEIGLYFDPHDIMLLSRSFGKKYNFKECIFDDYIILRDCSISDAILQSDEVSEIRWASMEDIVNLFHAGQFMFDDMGELDKVMAYIFKVTGPDIRRLAI